MTLEDALRGSDVVFVVGTGVSAALSQNAPSATWLGLIRSGVQRVGELDPSRDSEWSQLVANLLNYGVRSGTPEQVILAAGMVSSALRHLSNQAFADWLRDDIGHLPLRDRSVAEAIARYPFPILTTNYDTLLEQASGRESRDWTDARFQDVVARSSQAIGHLHGTWDHPDSVVLGEADYERLRAHESTQALERAISSLKSIVYIGFGGGLDDPNFSALYKWQRTVFPASSVVHYRLCLDSEYGELFQRHAADNVEPVAYGSQHGDLVSFLERLLPDRAEMAINSAGLVRDVVQEARESLIDSMTRDSLLADLIPLDRDSSSLILPPRLRAIPHARFVREQFTGKESAALLDPFDEVKVHDLIVVVGDDGSGLTTAVKWLAAESSRELGAAAPVFIRFRDCRNRRDPLGVALLSASRQAGLTSAKGQEVPAHVLAIDDFDPGRTKVAEPVLDQIAVGMSIVTILGCRQGDEEELVRGLQSRGLSPRLVFMGRMSRPDIRLLGDEIAPGQGSRLADEVIDHLDSNDLKRTPLTVGLLLALLARGAVQDSKNPTSILDAYVTFILTGGDPHDFPAGLSDVDLHAVLGKLAEYIVWEERASLSETETIRVVDDAIQRFGWSATASDVVRFLLRRRILRERAGTIEFGRFAYLTTFAAKRAMVDSEFRDLILHDLFYYSPVVERYAALSRSDEDLLTKLSSLIEEALSESLDDGTPYELISGDLITDPSSGQFSRPAPDSRSEDENEIEFPERDYAGGFGLVRTEMPVAARLRRSIVLISSVVRDLDQVEQLELKRSYLMKSLTLWGRLIAALSSDPTLTAMREAIVKQVAEDGASRKLNDDFGEFLEKAIPAATVMAGIETNLVSTKLTRLVEAAISEGEVSQSTERETATLFLLFLMRSEGWIGAANRILETASPTWVLAYFFHFVCRDAYVKGAEPEAELLDLCRTLALQGRRFSSAAVRGPWADQYVRDLRALRLRTEHAPSSPKSSD